MRRAAWLTSQLATPLDVQAVEYLIGLVTQGLPRETVNARAAGLAYFIAWCRGRAVTKPADVTASTLGKYRRHLHLVRPKEWQAAVEGCFGRPPSRTPAPRRRRGKHEG
jgi:hypothetical protein